ncbi:MAG: gamma-glutamyltransferase [Chloroflexi bacterium]|nr:gamma-glutamyltransferase [Chloroflexota bacterium]MCI0867132.1 gamma-glutamyltransferase [Chloroflexota bacterium]
MSVNGLSRHLVYGRRGMVCSNSPLAASAGIKVIQEGGNAFDAAVAVAAAEAVTIVPACGMGGDSFVLLYEAATGKVTGVNSSGVAGTGATAEHYRGQGYNTMPLVGPHAVSLPGEVAAWEEIHRRFCTRSLPQLLDSAIGYAQEGFPVPPGIGRSFEHGVAKLSQFTASAQVYLRDGRPTLEGDILVNRDLAHSLSRVAEGGAEEFYRGGLAREIVKGLQDAGGLFTEQDFAGHQAEVYDPITTTYRNHAVYQTRPPSQGFLLLEMLNLVEGFDLTSPGQNSANAIHLMAEAKKVAYTDRNRFAGDPKFVEWPLEELISKEYAGRRRGEIDPRRAAAGEPLLQPVDGDGDTTYFCVADGEGNAVSWVHSLSNAFGSGFMAPGTGILLNNRAGRGFSLVPGHPNIIAPGKRTMHTLNCYLTTVNGKAAIVGGTPGGDFQPQCGLQILTNLIDYRMDPQDAVEAPRWWSFPGTDPASIDTPLELRVEAEMPKETTSALEALGHRVARRAEGVHDGKVQLIVFDQETGVMMGASDPRGDGHAAAW